MKRLLLIIIYSGLSSLLFGQASVPKEYYVFSDKADSLYKIKDYKNASLNYSKAFETFGWKGILDDRFKAACCWALSGNIDSSFFNLDRIVNIGKYSNYFKVIDEPALNSLRNDVRWNGLIERIKQNRDNDLSNIKLPSGNYIENINKSLINLLDSLVYEDQKWRNYAVKFNNKELGDDTISMKTISYNMIRTDSLNYFQCLKIFSQYGFPDYLLVGTKGSFNFWLLVQHQDKQPEFQNSVCEMMKIAVDEGRADNSNYAYLADRVKINSHQLQIYGTQMTMNKDLTSYEPLPLIEPERLNERRKSMGLSTIEEYIETMNSNFHGILKKKEINH